jgi:hypothetical protein
MNRITLTKNEPINLRKFQLKQLALWPSADLRV